MNALIALAVWCQPHGPVTILTTQHRRPASFSSLPPSSSPQSPIPRNSDNGTPPPTIDSSSSTISSNSSTNPSLLDPTSVSSNSATQGTDQVPTPDQRKIRRAANQHHHNSPSTNSAGMRPVSTQSGLMSPSTSTHSMNSSSNACECQFSIPSGEKSLHSVDPANSALSYISQAVPVDPNLFAPIRMACIRSLNSETYCGREGSVFFGDGMNGYVLSYMFTVHDAQSRGQRVKYTIMTMMTDRVYLVASMEYLISQFQRIAANLQAMASALSPPQQSPATRSMSYSSSHHRGSIMPENAPTRRGRPLTDVLAKPDIFVQLHAAFVCVLSNCSQRLMERHIQGRPKVMIKICLNFMSTTFRPILTRNDRTNMEQVFDDAGQSILFTGEDSDCDAKTEIIDSLRELRRVLGRHKFDRLIWNCVVGNQVIVRGEETRIVKEAIVLLEDILPKACCTVHFGSQYEPTYECNILGLERSTAIPPDMDPQSFILLDICKTTFEHAFPSPSTFQSGDQLNGADNPMAQCYQANWSNDKLKGEAMTLPALLENIDISGVKSDVTLEVGATPPTPPTSASGTLYSPASGFKAQRRIYLLQAGEEPPEISSSLQSTNLSEKNGLGKELGGRRIQSNADRLYIETMNSILDLRLPRVMETARLSLLRDEWTSKSIQFYNLHRAGHASDESVVERFLQSMVVDKRDLKILRNFAKCARSQKFGRG
ncbi:folliculin [Entomortierella parvispora]|uniref:Folliculin n=1 Tax=Entomortierella parvispora TaxID=205924 RepID=A0A9P3H1Q1_9FUNG|nr:folliculin [Entomortierella parvispora]